MHAGGQSQQEDRVAGSQVIYPHRCSANLRPNFYSLVFMSSYNRYVSLVIFGDELHTFVKYLLFFLNFRTLDVLNGHKLFNKLSIPRYYFYCMNFEVLKLWSFHGTAHLCTLKHLTCYYFYLGTRHIHFFFVVIITHFIKHTYLVT